MTSRLLLLDAQHADHPAAEADLAIQTRPREIARVPTTRVADVDILCLLAEVRDVLRRHLVDGWKSKNVGMRTFLNRIPAAGDSRRLLFHNTL